MILTSCLDKSNEKRIGILPDNSTLTSTTLRDSLGTVFFSIPARFDTSFTWTNRSDCGKPCDMEQYRYQPKTLPIFEESGFYYQVPDIPVDQFTIVHSGYFPFGNGDTSKSFWRHDNFKDRLSSDPKNGTVVSDTIEKINDRYYSVVFMNGYDTKRQQHFAKVAALTTIKANEIELHYDINSKEKINLKAFYESSIRFIRTVRMSKGI